MKKINAQVTKLRGKELIVRITDGPDTFLDHYVTVMLPDEVLGAIRNARDWDLALSSFGYYKENKHDQSH